jgi:hypothetical protein
MKAERQYVMLAKKFRVGGNMVESSATSHFGNQKLNDCQSGKFPAQAAT